MSSQEELARCLQQMMNALAQNNAGRLSIVRDGDKPRAASFDPGFAVGIDPSPGLLITSGNKRSV
jgi:hypothetical protein